MTMTLISTVTVTGADAASIDLSSLPGTYTDLLFLASIRSSRSGASDDDARIRFNGSTTSYSTRILRGNGASASSTTSTDITIGLISTAITTSNTFANCAVYVPNYAGSTNKSVSADGVGENNATTAWQMLGAGLWSNTAAITSASISAVNGNLVTGSSVSVYGITKGSGGATVSP